MFEGKLTRRQLVIGAGATALAGALGLAGCGGDELVGKTLYSFPTTFSEQQPGVDEGEMSTITFNDEESWHYTGNVWDYINELTGTWTREGEDIVLTSAGGALGTVTLRKVDDGGGYSVSGMEDLEVRFFPSEDEALDYSKGFIEGSTARVRGFLESADWEAVEPGRVGQTKAPEIDFDGGELSYTKGEYQDSRFGSAPSDGWKSSDHSGSYELDVTSLLTVGMSDSPRYAGVLTMDGQQVDFALDMTDAYHKMRLTLDGDLFTEA